MKTEGAAAQLNAAEAGAHGVQPASSCQLPSLLSCETILERTACNKGQNLGINVPMHKSVEVIA